MRMMMRRLRSERWIENEYQTAGAGPMARVSTWQRGTGGVPQVKIGNPP